MTEPLHPAHFTCDECGTKVKGYQRFCHQCGDYLGSSAEEVSIFNNIHLRSAFLFYGIYLAICLLVRSTGWFNSYDRLFWIEVLLAAITLLFVRANRTALKPLLKFNNFNWLLLVAVIVCAALFSFVVNISVSELNISLFRQENSLYEGYDIYQLAVPIMIYSVALMPAIFEELAFRGILYNYLSNILDERLVVMITGFAFAAMHLSFISLVWLIPFGIAIGWLRRRYHTLWYGIIFHFVFNLTACLMDLYREGMLW
ncbi:CPBP family intramembrane glutamic endopeptidase [Foetidibacter luteolus]|uniref:CPBP family intramembrane glutamic endopeptidase n=1 Tax=Foetidibacter luteolus TaxID=2608880 RepID=UPI00129A4C61|nr:CPBP family intramembrane glutamic endopeptidase [Foetidibacter luteolus]